MEILALAPEIECLVEGHVTGLQPLNDLVQAPVGLLERELVAQGRTSCTRASRPPEASSTAIASPGATVAASRTMLPLERTIA